jgi:hypothetical protein
MNGNWYWTDGLQFWTGGRGGTAVGGAYANFPMNQPAANRYCLAMEARRGPWYGMDCTGIRPYICESTEENAALLEQETVTDH